MSRKIPPPPPPPLKSAFRVSKKTKVVLPKHMAAVMAVRIYYMEHSGASLREAWSAAVLPDGSFAKDEVTLTAMSNVFSQEKWQVQKRAFWGEIKLRVMEQAQTEIVAQTLDEARRMSTIRTKMEQALLVEGEKAIKPGSFEGMVGAVIRLDKAITDKRNVVAAFVAEASAEARVATNTRQLTAIPDTGEDGISDEEIERMAVELARARVDKKATRSDADEL